jgi:hypothetical protein
MPDLSPLAVEYLMDLRVIAPACRLHFHLLSPRRSYADPTPEEIARMDHPEWIAPAMWAYCEVGNGIDLAWTATEEQLEEHPECVGRLALRRMQDIYGSWEGIVYFEHLLRPGFERLRHFKVVDLNTEEAGVGFYHDEHQDPALYYLALGEGRLPEPLGVDFTGYLKLLTLSLGYAHWPLLLVELCQHVAEHPGQPFAGPQHPNAQDFVADMTALYPAFTLDAFVALYDQVRLRP